MTGPVLLTTSIQDIDTNSQIQQNCNDSAACPNLCNHVEHSARKSSHSPLRKSIPRGLPMVPSLSEVPESPGQK